MTTSASLSPSRGDLPDFETARGLPFILENVFGAIRVGMALITPFLHGWRRRWGATAEEIRKALPGDDLVPDPRWTATRAVTIQARPEAIYGYLVQLGQGRGGYYSYLGLENLVGCKMQNANRVLPQFQDTRPGDLIRLHPSPQAPSFPVAEIVPNEYLLMGTKPRYDADLKSTVGLSWLLYLDAQPDGSTRLIARFRTYYDPKFANRMAMGRNTMLPVHHVMETQMMRKIKALAERDSARR